MFGGLCPKHPELKGLRLKGNRDCVVCSDSRLAKYRNTQNGRIASARTTYSHRDRLKVEVLTRYGGKCQGKDGTCPETDFDVLTLDHVNNDGHLHRKELGMGSGGRIGGKMYRWAKKNGYPSMLQILCANCNMKKMIIYARKKRMTVDQVNILV